MRLRLGFLAFAFSFCLSPSQSFGIASPTPSAMPIAGCSRPAGSPSMCKKTGVAPCAPGCGETVVPSTAMNCPYQNNADINGAAFVWCRNGLIINSPTPVPTPPTYTPPVVTITPIPTPVYTPPPTFTPPPPTFTPPPPTFTPPPPTCNATNCPSPGVCNNGACMWPPPPPPTKRANGDPCSSGSQCMSGRCGLPVAGGGGSITCGGGGSLCVCLPPPTCFWPFCPK